MEKEIKNLATRVSYLESKYLKIEKDLSIFKIMNYLGLGIIIGLILTLLVCK